MRMNVLLDVSVKAFVPSVFVFSSKKILLTTYM